MSRIYGRNQDARAGIRQQDRPSWEVAMPLEERLRRLIGAAEGIDPSKVTAEHIARRRNELFSEIRFSHDSEYGGYSLRKLQVRTNQELKELEAKVNAELAALLGTSGD